MTSRCPRCDRPRGDQPRADATFAVHLWRRGRIQHNAAVAAAQDEQPGLCIEQTCYAHEVDWRARALAAETERDALRAEVDWFKAEVTRLTALVEKACDVASEAWSYLSDDHEARAAIAAEVNEIAGSLRKKEVDHA